MLGVREDGGSCSIESTWNILFESMSESLSGPKGLVPHGLGHVLVPEQTVAGEKTRQDDIQTPGAPRNRPV